MSSTTAIRHNPIECIKNPMGIFTLAGFSAAIGATNALAMKLFTATSPLGGAIFGATFAASFFLVSQLTDRVTERMGLPDTVRILSANLLSLVTAVALGILASTVAGFPVSVASAGIGLGALAGTIGLFFVGVGISLQIYYGGLGRR